MQHMRSGGYGQARRVRTLLDLLTPGVPPANEVWFCRDLGDRSREELWRERRLRELRDLLTPDEQRDGWPATWNRTRIEAIATEERARAGRR